MGIGDISDVERLKKINAVLMSRVERSMDQQGNAFSLFQTAINLENRIRLRTEELHAALRRLEQTNVELVAAKNSAERANQSKTRFLAAASHDILQPLNAAALSVSALAELQTGEQGRDLVAQVERSLETMEALLRTLLDISRLEAGVMRPELCNLPLEALLSSLASDFLPLAERRGLRLKFRPAAGLTVRSDKTMLRRILQNLLSNAMRYTRRGGVVVGARIRDGMVRIDIADTGQGIGPEQREAIFEEFHRGPAMGDETGEAGLGLGLAIVRSMAAALGHAVWYRSRVGRGTVFHVELPLAGRCDPTEPGEEAAAPRLERPRSFVGRKVLLLENDESTRRAMGALLDGWRCSVTTAASAVEAREALSDTSWVPDLVIADQHLDDGDLGTVIVEQIRAFVGRPLPAILITADATETVIAAARAAGAEVIRKPLKPAQLRALMAHLLS